MTAPGSELRCEVLVVGSGAGGALAAALLAEAGRDVVLAEEGPFVAPGTLRPFSADEFERQYRDGGLTPALGDPPVPFAEGRCVGGSTEINAALYHRPPADAVARWRAEYRVDGLEPGALDAACLRNESEIGLANHPAPFPPMSGVLIRGAEALGWKVQEVPRLWRYPDGVPGGVKQTMARAVVPRATAAGARLLADCRVVRLRGAGSRVECAEAVTFGDGGPRPLAIRADAYFVCGGAVQTPLLLRSSGFDGRVGRTFGLHPMIKCAARFDEPMEGHLAGVPVHQVKQFAPDLSIGGSVSTPAHLATHFAENWATHADEFRAWRRMGIFYATTRGTTAGSVAPFPGSRSRPLVRFPSDDRGIGALWEGLDRLGGLLFAAGARALYPAVAGTPPIRSADAWKAFIGARPARGRIPLVSVHLFGSCPMGEDAARCATDSYGRLRGVENVTVCDASLLPDGPGVNPAGTVMALARRNVEAFLASRPGPVRVA